MTQAGEKYGRLTIVEPSKPTKRTLSRWVCQCDCGKELAVQQADLRNGHTRSCGCLRAEVTGQTKRKHGKSETTEYRIWSHMIGRCYNETDHKYPDYGGRGIRVCERWRESFNAFLVDMGPRPSLKHSINRVDNNADYDLKNCAWATPLEQGQNKRNNVFVVLDGERVVTAEAARRLGVSFSTIYGRTMRGLTHQEAVDALVAKRKRRRAIASADLPNAAPQGNA